MKYLASQFAHPRGLIGRLVGHIMAYENRERNAWAVSLLNVQPADRVLEIGCGPGWAVQQVAATAGAGFVSCVDVSEVMVRLARERNAAAVREGRVELKQGSALALPYETEAFDKVLAVNSLHHWPAPAQGLRESWRVLMPGGLLVIVEQPRSVTSEAGLQRLVHDLTEQLSNAGFQHVHVATRAMCPAASVAVMGRKPLDPSSS